MNMVKISSRDHKKRVILDSIYVQVTQTRDYCRYLLLQYKDIINGLN